MKGIKDSFIVYANCLAGFAADIETVIPEVKIQNYIIHRLRNSGQYVSYKDLKVLMAKLKVVYAAVGAERSGHLLEALGLEISQDLSFLAKTGLASAPISSSSRTRVSAVDLYHTTNTIESFSQKLRKVIKFQVSVSCG